MINTMRFPKARRHTYYFLRYAKEFSPVYLSTDIDFTQVKVERQRQLQELDVKISYITFVIHTVSRVLKHYPEANTAIRHSLLPKMAWYKKVNAKFTLDSMIDKTRVVLSGLIPNTDELSLHQIQEKINYYREHSFREINEFTPVQKLQSLPLGIGQWMYNKAIKNLSKREQLQGTFTVTSLGHQPIQSFFPIISSTTCFGMGAIQNRPVVVKDEVEICPMLTLSLVFDHRAIDGAMAADILTDVKTNLETGYQKGGALA